MNVLWQIETEKTILNHLLCWDWLKISFFRGLTEVLTLPFQIKYSNGGPNIQISWLEVRTLFFWTLHAIFTGISRNNYSENSLENFLKSIKLIIKNEKYFSIALLNKKFLGISSVYYHLAKSINSIMRMEFQTTGTVALKKIIISNLPLNFTLFNWFCIVIRFKSHWYHLKTVNGLAFTQKSYNLRSLCH